MVPVVGLLLLVFGLCASVARIYNALKTPTAAAAFAATKQPSLSLHNVDLTSLLIQFIYAALLTVGMEYVARYEHEHLWHSNLLWYFHASHHHQKVRFFGQGPAASIHKKVEDQDDNNNDDDSKRSSSLDTSAMERNDVFAIVFASLAIMVLCWGFLGDGPATAFRDCAVGSAAGISIYGTSYFIGHDLCAHERGGKVLAAWLRRISPFMARCAAVHVQYHHHVSKAKATAGNDPYGPPYGFWLGEAEIKAMSQGGNEKLRMPGLLRFAFTLALAFFGYSAYAHFQLIL